MNIRLGLCALLPALLLGQETRSMIFGRVLDPQGSAVAGAAVLVTNTSTNVSVAMATNETGYYEANLLLPGSYRVTVEWAGFKKTIRGGVGGEDGAHKADKAIDAIVELLAAA